MKIEKLSDNQIRCTLTRADLAERQLHLSELAYGTEKARSLFHDMMEQAADEFGFETDNMPLMIEAIPSTSDSIVLVITKVDDPEELDTRFSKFAPLSGPDTAKQNPPDKLDGAESLLDLLGKFKEKINAAQAPAQGATAEQSTAEAEPEKNEAEAKSGVRVYSFSSMDTVLKASRFLSTMYFGANTLYKDPIENVYLLAMTQSTHTAQDFSKLCNMLSEFGTQERTSGATLAFLEEHCKLMIANDAVQQLSAI